MSQISSRESGAGRSAGPLAEAKTLLLKWGRVRALQVVAVGLVLLVIGSLLWRQVDREKDLSIVNGQMTRVVKRGDLRISFIEKGEIKAAKSVEIFCEVEGRSTIVSIVPEGNSVKEGDVLVELDSSELTQAQNQQQISVEQATAAYEQAAAQVEIQKSLNESSIQQAQLNLLLAQIDLEKYTGEKGDAGVAWDPLVLLLADASLFADVSGRAREEIEAALQNAVREKELREGNSDATPRPAAGDADSETPAPAVSDMRSASEDEDDAPDYTKAGQKLKTGDFLLAYQKALADVKIASAEVARAQNQKDWTEALAQKGYVTGTEVVADRLTLQKAELNEQQAKGTLQLFLTYSWRQNFEKYKSDVEQAKAALDRAIAKANAELSQAQTDLSGKQATLNLSQKRLTKIEDQLKKTKILAPQDGMVVYQQERRYGRDSAILEAGGEVFENQLLMRLPDVGTMAVEVSVHESWVDQVREGLPAYVSIDALPNLNLKGRVTKVGLLPDHVNRWLNPDLKVYETDVTLEDSSGIQLLRPGMSAKVELVVSLLKNVLFVPVQSVTTIDKQQVCYVLQGGEFKPQPVVGGRYNESYIEIVSGLSAGDVIQLNAPPPQGSMQAEVEEGDIPEEFLSGDPRARGGGPGNGAFGSRGERGGPGREGGTGPAIGRGTEGGRGSEGMRSGGAEGRRGERGGPGGGGARSGGEFTRERPAGAQGKDGTRPSGRGGFPGMPRGSRASADGEPGATGQERPTISAEGAAPAKAAGDATGPATTKVGDATTPETTAEGGASGSEAPAAKAGAGSSE